MHFQSTKNKNETKYSATNKKLKEQNPTNNGLKLAL